MSPASATPAPRLNAFDIGCVVIGGIVGVGIFIAPQKVALVVDDPAQMMIAWCLGGFIALCGALVFAELSRLAPGFGGTFVYIEAAFGALPAFLYGWANWLVIQSGAVGVVGLVMVDNADVLLYGGARGDADRSVLLTVLAIAAFTAVNALGLRLGARVQNAFTVLKLAAIFGLVLVGLLVGESATHADTAGGASRGLLAALAAAMLPVLFAFGGWQQGAFVAGAAKRPLRDVPLGVGVGVAVVVVAYLTINLTYLNLLGFTGARESRAVAADACRAALAPFGIGDLAARVMAGAITISALGIMNTILLAPPWVLQAMARRGLFLRACAHVHPRFGSPIVGVLVQGGWAIVLLLAVHAVVRAHGRTTDSLGYLLDGVVFVDWLFYALCGFALLRLARRPGAQLLSRWSPLVAVLFCALACAVMIGAIAVSPWPSLVGGVLCGVGVLAYLRWRPASGGA